MEFGSVWWPPDPQADACDGKEFTIPERCGEVLSNVLDSRVLAVGRRHADYIARDFLLGGTFRDARASGFHWMLRAWMSNPPFWLEEYLADVPAVHHAQVTQLVLLHYLHKRSLEDPLQRYRSEDGEPPNVFERVWHCWPYGALFDKPQSPGRFPDIVCRIPRLCPWCLTRKVVALHARLANRLNRVEDTSHLVRIGFTLTPEMIPEDVGRQVGNEAILPSAYKNFENFYWEPSPDGPPSTGWHWHLTKAEVAYVRRVYWPKVRKFAQRLGVRGGILVHQIGPGMMATGERSFRHELALLGEVVLADQKAEREFESRAGLDGSRYCALKGPDEASSVAQILAMPTNDPRALRFFLCGSSVGYPVRSLPLRVDPGVWDEPNPWLRNGIPGVFAPQPLYVMNTDAETSNYDSQYDSYVLATRGFPLFEAFGSWRGPVDVPSVGKATKSGANPVDSVAGQLSGLRLANQERQQDAVARRSQLMQRAEPIWNQLTLPQSVGRGRPAVRQSLLTELKASGIALSRRDADWLMKELKK